MNLINLIDENIYNLIMNLRNERITAVIMFISFLGSSISLIILSIAQIFLNKDKKDAKFITLNLIFIFLLNRLLKLIIARPRPSVLSLVQENGYSFPSGHAMVSMAFYGFIIYLINMNIKNKKIKYPIIIILTILIFLIGISRIYLGVHYATDIIGGFVIGFIYLLFFIKYVYKQKK